MQSDNIAEIKKEDNKVKKKYISLIFSRFILYLQHVKSKMERDHVSWGKIFLPVPEEK